MKDILARVQGLQPCFHLAKRDRRLLAHGMLERIEDAAAPLTCLPDLMGCHAQQRTNKLVEAIDDWEVRRGRAGSVKSTSSSATGVSTDSRSSTSSSFPQTPSSECFPSRFSLVSPSPKSKVDSGYASLSGSDGSDPVRGIYPAPPLSHSNVELKIKPTHAFVFSDVVLFTSPIPPGEDGDMNWILLDDIGIVRVLGISETVQSSGMSSVIPETGVGDNFASATRLPDRSRSCSNGPH